MLPNQVDYEAFQAELEKLDRDYWDLFKAFNQLYGQVAQYNQFCEKMDEIARNWKADQYAQEQIDDHQCTLGLGY